MSKRLLLLLMLCLLPALACTLTSSDEDDSTVPTIPVNPGGNDATPTEDGDVPVTATATTRPTATATQDNGGGGEPSGPPALSGMSFSTTAGGSNITVFPSGTQEVHLRFNYSNVPVGTLMTREWYRDGRLVTTNQDDWSNNWGSTGRLTHIKLFDYTTGLASGNYYVIVKLPSYGLQIDGSFSIASGDPPIFDDLRFSATQNGAATTAFPYGTEQVYARWNFANVPAGAVMRRYWYRDGVLIISREEPWRAEWGRTGTLSHVRTYNFTSGYGLEPGNYRVVIDLRDFASARVEASFVIEGNVGPRLSNLRFATSGNGTPATQFAEGTEEVFAIFDYSSIPLRAQMRRRWWRNDALIVDRTEAWDFDRYGTSGTVRDISLFDRINGLSSGEYDVEITIVGQPGVIVTGSFVIQDAPVPDPVFNSLSFGTTPTSTAQTNFEASVTEVFARWRFANIPDGANLELQWFHDETPVHTDSTTWDQGASGTYASSISDASGLAAGNWRVAISLNGYPTASLEGSFTVALAVTPALSNLELSVTPGGPTETTFPPDVGNLYAQFDFADVPQGTEVVANLVSTDAGIDVRLSGSWTYVTTGRVTDLWIGDPTQPLPPGSYGLVIGLPEYGTETSAAFTIEPPPDGEFDPASVSYSVPPQLDDSAPPGVPPQGIWTDAE